MPYLRSSMYNAKALFFVLSGADPGKEADFDRCDTAWQAALDSGTWASTLRGDRRRASYPVLLPEPSGWRPVNGRR